MIRFPKLHIAESVENRLRNFVDGLDSDSSSLPSLPEPSPAGAELDERLSSSPTGAAPDAAVIEGAVTGKTPLESMIEE